MKKFSAIIPIIMIVLLLSSCGKESTPNDSSDTFTPPLNEETAKNYTMTIKQKDPSTYEELEEIILQDANNTIAGLYTEYEKITLDIDTYDKYQKNVEHIENFYSEIQKTVKDLCVRMREYSVTYAELILSSGKDDDEIYDDLDNIYDCIYDDASDEIYDEIYDGILDNMYDFYYDGILDDVYENVPYREWSDVNTNEYRQWSDTSTEVYREWSDFSSDVYAFWSNLSSKIWNGNMKEANEVIRDFQEDIENLKNGKQRTNIESNIESKNPEAEITDIPLETDTPTNEPVNGIRTEFKTAMDSYEEFFDEYATFMNNFSNSDNALAALSDYADFMSRYAETMEAMEALGEEDMSTEEAAYYLEVTTRINQKLLGALS